MHIRDYETSDLAEIEQIHPYFAVQLNHHGGIDKNNVYCAVDEGKIIGIGFLTLPSVFNAKGITKIALSTCVHNVYKDVARVDSLLTDQLIQRYRELTIEHPAVKMCLHIFCETDEIDGMQVLLEKGFCLSRAIPVMKYDLSQKTRHYQIPDDVTIGQYSFTEPSMKEYIKADSEASDEPDSEADVWFRIGDPSFSCFAAQYKGQVIGAISVWNITEERAATENIFVIPKFRRSNIARELIATAFDELKNRGMKIATLSMSGTNLPAMKLYLSTGYTLIYNLIEMVYDLSL